MTWVRRPSMLARYLNTLSARRRPGLCLQLCSSPALSPPSTSRVAGMFVRGGVYRVVKEAMGSTLAKFSVSALMFDYILTGPISGVSAGLYLMGLLNELLQHSHMRTLP